MTELINLDSFVVQETLDMLLKDNTTNKNIIWATKSYENNGVGYEETSEITIDLLKGLNSIDIQPRVLKSIEEQKNRTKKRAEVFTPSWVCNFMNNAMDETWFGRKDVFNVLNNEDHTWQTNKNKIQFEDKPRKRWTNYVLLRNIEATCGEAPYLVSRYDTTTGEIIELENRIGILDRKLRVVSENTQTEEEWFKWVVKAYQSTYGYEFQGDNLLIARINLILTFVDYLEDKWNRQPTKKELKKIARIISWNIWQMDGLTNTVPMSKIETKIRNWRNGNSFITFRFKEMGAKK